MSDYYCLDIEFPNVDFSNYFIKSKTEVSKIHHAHLTFKDNEIELKIFYDDQSYFGHKLMMWANKIDLAKFGAFLKVEKSKNNTNERLQKVDLSQTTLISCTTSSNYYENGNEYIILKINNVKLYWIPNEFEKLTAEFYLDKRGFSVVEPFYSFLSQKSIPKDEANFDIGRMNDSREFYKLGKSLFRPEFNFVARDSRKERIAKVIKEPKIHFNYTKGITEEEATFYGDVVLMLASFYHHTKIDYTLRRIHLPENTITIKKIEQNFISEETGNLWGFEIHWDFNKFLQASWQKETVKNFALLFRTITLFNQSHLVDSSAAFLIRYNIIEICGSSNVKDSIWNFTLNNKDLDNFFNETKNSISNIIDEEEQEHFNKKWISILNIIKSKSLRKKLEDSLSKNEIDINKLPIKTNKLVQIRNNITHGSIEKINAEELRKANILLYRINGILILNLMGIKDWKLNTELT